MFLLLKPSNHVGRLLCILLPEARARLRDAVFPLSYFSSKVNANMADSSDVLSRLSRMNLGSSGDDTERSAHFWNRSCMEMKFSVEKLWLDAVWKCKKKPNYGMRNLDAVLEERASNKLELTGPLIDGFLCVLGKAIYAKLGRSRNTGLMPPVNLYVPYNILRHIFSIAVGYGGKLTNHRKTMSVTIETFENALKVVCSG